MSLDPNTVWRAADGRLWSLALMGPVSVDDASLAERDLDAEPFIVWPKRNGEQTLDALHEVLRAHGIEADLAAYASQVRFARETAGIEVGGERIDTSRESQALITGAHALALAEPDEAIDFKSSTGWVVIDSAAMILVALAVARHVRACFRTERAVAAAIAAGTITTQAEIDAAFAG